MYLRTLADFITSISYINNTFFNEIFTWDGSSDHAEHEFAISHKKLVCRLTWYVHATPQLMHDQSQLADRYSQCFQHLC